MLDMWLKGSEENRSKQFLQNALKQLTLAPMQKYRNMLLGAVFGAVVGGGIGVVVGGLVAGSGIVLAEIGVRTGLLLCPAGGAVGGAIGTLGGAVVGGIAGLKFGQTNCKKNVSSMIKQLKLDDDDADQ